MIVISLGRRDHEYKIGGRTRHVTWDCLPWEPEGFPVEPVSLWRSQVATEETSGTKVGLYSLFRFGRVLSVVPLCSATCAWVVEPRAPHLETSVVWASLQPAPGACMCRVCRDVQVSLWPFCHFIEPTYDVTNALE